MKKRILKLKKETITELDKSLASKVKGGLLKLTAGCTDGCSPAMTYWNCTEAAGNCTADCDTRTTTAGATCHTL